jgi:hypothetical protein
VDYRPRVSIFFILMGLGLLTVFLLSILGREIKIVYLLLAGASLFLGYVIRPKKAPVEPTRFGTIRRMNERSRQRRQAQSDKRHKK